MKTLSIITAVVCLIAMVFVAFKTNILREEGGNSSYSFSRFQMWLWSTVIIPAFVLNWATDSGGVPSLNEASLVLLGISVSSLFGSNIITSVQKSEHRKLLTAGINTTSLFKFQANSDGFWNDILKDDSGHLSVARLQNLMFTFVFVMMYIYLFFDKAMKYPDFQQYTYALMGISTGGYVTAKAVQK